MATLIKSKAVWTFIIGVMIIGLVAVVRTDEDIYTRHEYLLDKIAHSQVFDMILIGNSRMESSLSPAEMGKFLTNYRIHNFAFPGQGYSQKYLDAAVARLDPASSKKCIVIAIAPTNLMRESIDRQNEFDHYEDRREEMYWSSYLDPFTPVRKLDIRQFIPELAVHVGDMRGRHFGDGYAALLNMLPEDETLSKYEREVFAQGGVEEEAIERILNFVEECSSKGIKVFGVRIPTTSRMVEIEDRKSGLDYEQFSRKFSGAGGQWLTFREDHYKSRDGNHLHGDGAIEFSQDFAIKLASEHLQ